MSSESPTKTNAPTPFPYPTLQRIFAIPPLLLWSFLAVVAVIWIVGTGIGVALGNSTGGGDGRFLYLCILLPVVLAAAGVTFKTIWRAYRGRSALWWHGATLVLGLVCVALMGVVGD